MNYGPAPEQITPRGPGRRASCAIVGAQMRVLAAAALFLLALALLVSPGDGVSAAPAMQVCAGNLLVNPDFDGGSRKTENLGTSISSAVSDGWFPWFIRGSENINREPEFKVEQVAIGGDPFRVRSGGNSMKWFSTWSTHTAGMYQTVSVPSGVSLTFTIHAMVYSGEADGWNGDLRTFLSDMEKYGNYNVTAGIDPTGATPAGMGSGPPASVVWGPSSMQPDAWVPLTATAVSQGNAVTVYAKGAPEWSVKHNDSFWDDACLVVGGRAAAPAPAPVQAAEQAAPAEQQPAQPVEERVAPAPPEPVVAEGPSRSVTTRKIGLWRAPVEVETPIGGGWVIPE